ncbi:MAG: acety-l/propionyl-CoA carboxylase subunit alpha, partial [Actinobacteria bacterium]|nr:acety-l/propionyl-CoA carboxylase subunit alpha [Actinomycetota bacterium]
MIRRLLVANRGEVARRIFRTCRDLGVATAAVYEEPDRAEPFVREADEAVPVGSYLAAEEIVAAAARVGADAVHPGWGFHAEDAPFAQRCLDAGLAFVGPPPHGLAAAGSKRRSRAR